MRLAVARPAAMLALAAVVTQTGRTSAEETPIGATGRHVTSADSSRIVAVGGSVTEILFALGAGERVVAVDTSSVFPEQAARLPQVGYQRTLSAEGVLSVRPTLIVATVEAGPPPVLEQLRASAVPLLMVPADPTIDGAKAKIALIAAALDRREEGQALIRTLDADLALAEAQRARVTAHPGVLFLYARGQGILNVAGTGTAADEMIRLAGGRNAITAYEGYKPLTAEGAVAAAPDVVLLPARGLDSLDGIDAVLALPGLALTPAAKNRRVIAMDDLYLLGFGPRTGRAVLDLATQLHAPPAAADQTGSAPAPRGGDAPGGRW